MRALRCSSGGAARSRAQVAFGAMGAALAALAVFVMCGELAHPWGTEATGPLQASVSRGALTALLASAAMSHAAAAATLALLSPRAHERRQPAYVYDARLRAALGVAAAAASANAAWWLGGCAAARGPLLGGAELLLGWCPAAFVAASAYVVREASMFGRDLERLRAVKYDFKKA